jgi:CBS domain protein
MTFSETSLREPRGARESWVLSGVIYFKPEKTGWLGLGLPGEGREKSEMVSEYMEISFPSCGVNNHAQAARQQAEEMNFDVCPVLNQDNVVLGLIRTRVRNANTSDSAAAAMETAPKTLRPYTKVSEAKKLLKENSWSAILVTSSDGKLLGLFRHPGGDFGIARLMNQNRSKDE